MAMTDFGPLPAPFVTDSIRDRLRRRLAVPTGEAANAAARSRRGVAIADELRGRYTDYDQLESAMAGRTVPQYASSLPVADAGSGEGYRQLQGMGYRAVEGDDGEGNGVTSWIAPDQVDAYDEAMAQQEAFQLLGNEINQRAAAERNQEAAARQAQLYQQNQMFGDLSMAGVTFGPGALNNATVRDQIWEGRNNLPGLVRRQSNDPEGFLRSPGSRSPFSMRYLPQTEMEMGGDMVDPRAPRYQGATAGPNGVVEEQIGAPVRRLDRPSGGFGRLSYKPRQRGGGMFGSVSF